MKVQWQCAAVVIITLLSASTLAQVQAAKLLTVVDVISVVKNLKGMKTVEKDLTTVASGDVNFADGSGEVFLMMTLRPAAEFKLMKSTAADRVAGVGDEAYHAPNAQAAAGMPPYMLIFRKGAHAVMLVSTFDANGAPRVSQAQLKQLATLVASRL